MNNSPWNGNRKWKRTRKWRWRCYYDRKVWVPTTADTFKEITQMRSKPSIVPLHSSTNDLQTRSTEQISKSVVEIVEVVIKNKSMKFWWSSILPRYDNGDLYMKADLVNALPNIELFKKNGADICRNDNFYNDVQINTESYSDGVHTKEQGIVKLAKNIK